MTPGFEELINSITRDSISMITEFVIPKVIEIFAPYIPWVLAFCGIKVILKIAYNKWRDIGRL